MDTNFFFTYDVSKPLQGKGDHRGKKNHFLSSMYLDGQFLCLTVDVNSLKWVYRVTQMSLDV